MAIVAHTRLLAIGVDTHARSHTFAVLTAATGELIAAKQFPATSAGLTRAVDWASRLMGGIFAALWESEGAATYGARLSRTETDAGYEVAEAPCVARPDDRKGPDEHRAHYYNVNALTALLRTADLRLDARKPLTIAPINEVAA